MDTPGAQTIAFSTAIFRDSGFEAKGFSAT